MSPLLLAPRSCPGLGRSVALVNDFTSYIICQVSALLIVACGTSSAMLYLSRVVVFIRRRWGFNRRRGGYRLRSPPDPTAPGLAPYCSQAYNPDRSDISHRPPGWRASAPFTRSVTTLSRSAINRKTLGQRFSRISVSDQSHGWHAHSARRRCSAALPSLLNY